VSRRYLGGLLSTSSPVASISTASGLWTLQQQFVQVGQGAWPGLVPPSLYAFTDATFTPGGKIGNTGPSLAQARTGLTGTGVDAWKNDTSYFNTSDGIQLWTVPATGSYRIQAFGAGGAPGTVSAGVGAVIRGDFTLTQGEVIRIVAGQAGVANGQAGGGGGGSFVVRTPYNTNVSILVIAGGGGGGPGPCCGGQAGAGNASTGPNGTQAPDPGGVSLGAAGTNGNGGAHSHH
jgi:hypothetical protein